MIECEHDLIPPSIDFIVAHCKSGVAAYDQQRIDHLCALGQYGQRIDVQLTYDSAMFVGQP
jgi:hypothetical protein